MSPTNVARFSIAAVWIWTTKASPNWSTTSPGKSSDSDHTKRRLLPASRRATARSIAPRMNAPFSAPRSRLKRRQMICDFEL
jgi:hypothetical protein